MLEQSQKLTELIKVLFAELPEVVVQAVEDAEALADIFESQSQAESDNEEWAKDITYKAEIGILFKDTLSISPDGIVWGHEQHKLENITRVRWGGVSKSVNGISTGTDYVIGFGDDSSESVVHLRDQVVFSKFVEKLWKAVGARILMGLLELWRSGREIRFGQATVRDDGITLIKHRLFGANEYVRCSWAQVHVGSVDGSFHIVLKQDTKTYVKLSYIEDANTHILARIIDMAFDKQGMKRLSDII